MAGRQRALLEDGADRGSPHRLLPGQRLNCQDAVNDLVIVDRQTDMTGRVEDQLEKLRAEPVDAHAVTAARSAASDAARMLRDRRIPTRRRGR